MYPPPRERVLSLLIMTTADQLQIRIILLLKTCPKAARRVH